MCGEERQTKGVSSVVRRRRKALLFSRFFSTLEKTGDKTRVAGRRTRAGVRIRFLFRRAAVSESSSDARVFGKRVLRWLPRAYRRPWPPPPPRTTRGSCPRRARTPPRLSKKKRTGNVRGVLRQRGGNVRDSRMGFGVRFFACRARIEAICGRLARAHLPRRLCRLCRTRLRPGTGPTR